MFCLLLDYKAPRFQYKINTTYSPCLGRELDYELDKVFMILNLIVFLDIHFIILKQSLSQCSAWLLTVFCVSKSKYVHFTLKSQMVSKLSKAFEPPVGKDLDYYRGFQPVSPSVHQYFLLKYQKKSPFRDAPFNTL